VMRVDLQAMDADELAPLLLPAIVGTLAGAAAA
jgi:hypothetical protein